MLYFLKELKILNFVYGYNTNVQMVSVIGMLLVTDAREDN